jgi:hypothetical protein
MKMVSLIPFSFFSSLLFFTFLSEKKEQKTADLAGRKHLVNKALQNLEEQSSEEEASPPPSPPPSPLIQPKREKESPRRASTSFQKPMDKVISSAPYPPYTFRLEKEVFFFWWRMDGGKGPFTWFFDIFPTYVEITVILPSPTPETFSAIDYLKGELISLDEKRTLNFKVEIPEGMKLSVESEGVKKFTTDHLFGFSSRLRVNEGTLRM